MLWIKFQVLILDIMTQKKVSLKFYSKLLIDQFSIRYYPRWAIKIKFFPPFGFSGGHGEKEGFRMDKGCPESRINWIVFSIGSFPFIMRFVGRGRKEKIFGILRKFSSGLEAMLESWDDIEWFFTIKLLRYLDFKVDHSSRVQIVLNLLRINRGRVARFINN